MWLVHYVLLKTQSGLKAVQYFFWEVLVFGFWPSILVLVLVLDVLVLHMFLEHMTLALVFSSNLVYKDRFESVSM